LQANYVVISGTGNERYNSAVKAVDDFLTRIK